MKDEALTIDGCDDAIIGIARRCGQMTLVVYDYDKLIRCFIEQDMSELEAVEWVDYNIAGAWVGEGTPLILYPWDIGDSEALEV